MLSRAAEVHRTFMVLEDAHWMDAARKNGRRACDP
jgi:hypothetical protein